MESQQTVFGLSRDNASLVSYLWLCPWKQSPRSWGLYRKSVKKNVEGMRYVTLNLKLLLVLTDSLFIVVLRCGGDDIGNSKSDLKICMMWAILADIHCIKFAIEGAFLLS